MHRRRVPVSAWNIYPFKVLINQFKKIESIIVGYKDKGPKVYPHISKLTMALMANTSDHLEQHYECISRLVTADGSRSFEHLLHILVSGFQIDLDRNWVPVQTPC